MDCDVECDAAASLRLRQLDALVGGEIRLSRAQCGDLAPARKESLSTLHGHRVLTGDSCGGGGGFDTAMEQHLDL